MEGGFEIRFRVLNTGDTDRPKVAMHVKRRRNDSKDWNDVETVYFVGTDHPHAAVLMPDCEAYPGFLEWCVRRIVERGDMSMPSLAAAREAGAIQ